MESYCISVYEESLQDLSKEKMKGITSKISSLIAKGRFKATLEQLASAVEAGFAWCPAVFTGDKKIQDDLQSIQLFALDFDGELTFDEARRRAEKYYLPIALYYETKTSVNFSKFRLVFACVQEVHDKDLAILIQYCLCTVFEGVDTTSKDFSKLYFPGRNVSYDEEAHFSVYDLLLSTMQYLGEHHPTNKARILRQLAKKSNVLLINNVFAVSDHSVIYDSGAPLLPETQSQLVKKYTAQLKIEDFRTITIYNMDDAQNSSKIESRLLFFTRNGMEGKSYKTEKPAKARINLEGNQICQLLNDFLNGRRLQHEEWFGLALNLIHIKGGQELFKSTIHKYLGDYGDIDRKWEQIQWAKQNGYHAARCEEYCPYSDSCQHQSNMVYTLKSSSYRIIKLNEDTVYKEIQVLRDELRGILAQIKNISGIYIIKAPTGAGKTYAYLYVIAESSGQSIVALPNARLMYAVAQEASSMGIDCMTTPIVDEMLEKLDDETAERIRECYQRGDERTVNFILRNCDSPAAREYLKEVDNIPKFNGKLILTTHARFLNMKPEFLKGKNVYIDEDILPVMIQIETVSVSEIRKILADDDNGRSIPIPDNIMRKLKEIISVRGYEKLTPIGYELEHDEKSIVLSHIPKSGMTSKVFHAMESEYFYYNPKTDKEYIYFLFYRRLPDCNCVILSATANEMIYRKLLRNKLTSFIDMGQLRYKGKLELYADYSYSRFCLQEHPDLLPKIRMENPKHPVITFKEYKESGELYLGAAQGMNYLQGKDITVIGTFHRPEYVYKLWGMLLGCTDTTDTLSVRRITRNGFNFPFYTYQDNLLREIQLWMIESESEQAVGRARIVLNACTVRLYSNFPLKQCEIIRNRNEESEEFENQV